MSLEDFVAYFGGGVVCVLFLVLFVFIFWGVFRPFLANTLCKILLFFSFSLIQDSPTFLRREKTFYEKLGNMRKASV